MTLNITIPAPTPLTVQLGNITAPGAITPAAGQATVADFMFNTFSQSLRNLLVKSATPRRIEIQGTTSQPVVVCVGGRWGKATSTVFANSALTGLGYVFVVVNSDGTLSLRLSASATLNAFELLVASYYDTGAAIKWLNSGILGTATDITGLFSLSGSSGGLRLFDRSLSNFWYDLYVTGGLLTLADQAGNTILAAQNQGGANTAYLGVSGISNVNGPNGKFTASDQGATVNGHRFRSSGGWGYLEEDGSNKQIIKFGATGGFFSGAWVIQQAAGTIPQLNMQDQTGGNANSVTIKRVSDTLSFVDSVNGTVFSIGNSGLTSIAGALNGLITYDRTGNSHFSLIYRTGDTWRLNEQGGTDIWIVDSSGYMTQPAWTIPAAGTGFTFTNVGYRKVKPSGDVQMRGLMTFGAGQLGNGSVAFTLPAGSRPLSLPAYISVAATNGGGAWYGGLLYVDGSGNVEVFGPAGTTGVGLDGVRFATT